ncbi:molybdopterin-binding oxidoreductase [Nocardia donostiensis]|uniref:Molybdopterin-binding oxidoreductase n=2 Tax=Nocardia donostiensis TaxID=1538463 RepID=A0A1V2TA85_9NOCA|nr:molybdopterin-binding oxidoreductase [Nocardia donostiensis]OQS16427.1 molybdopterin-binding oxidoreductase [Nocardia donostiensis]OQS18309.1 molybdopterin-binding oxidoreductase [Nocardia donostiensis]
MSRAGARAVVKPTPPELMEDFGDGLNYGTRLSNHPGYLTPIDRFFVRNHGATPVIDARTWQLRVDGSGVRRPVVFSYEQLWEMPLTSVVRAIQCAGNGRVFFAERFGREAEGTQWRTGALSTAEWTGVRLRELLERAGPTVYARDVMPEGLDELRFDRPMPLAKAMADDTIVALAMNGEVLPCDHGFPARVVVSGWVGTASVKWVGRIQVAAEELHSYWNTRDYVLAGPGYPRVGPAEGVPITVVPPMSVIELDWPAVIPSGARTIRGRAFSGADRVVRVAVQADDAAWRQARLLEPNIAGAWVRWEIDWLATPGEHGLRVRATDAQGNVQPDTVPWNDHGCLYNAVVAHPVRVW